MFQHTASARRVARLPGGASQPSRQPLRRSRLTPLVALLTALALAILATGCGVRLETPPPSEPVPDALELVRRTAVQDALGVATIASDARGADVPEGLDEELLRIAHEAQLHSDSLGGTYVSGLPTQEDMLGDGNDDPAGQEPAGQLDGDEPLAPPPSTPPPSISEVVTALADASSRTRLAANSTAYPEMARLLGSISTAQAVSASRLALMADLPQPQFTAPHMPGLGDLVDTAHETEGQATTAAAPEPENDELIVITLPGEEELIMPQGLGLDDLAAIVSNEHATSYALEVSAARHDGELRDVLLARSQVHRERAHLWALYGQINNTEQDPRRIAYSIPDVGDVPGLIIAMETVLSITYASVVGRAAPGTRLVAIDLMLDSALMLNEWGAAPQAFPGLPEASDFDLTWLDYLPAMDAQN